MSSDSTPVSRLRERHRLWPILDRPDVQLCIECTDPYPCDVIAALDELEERDDLSYEPEALREFRERGYVTKEVDALQARINEAAGMFDSALWWIGEDWLRDRIRAWLEGDKEKNGG